VIVVIAVPNTLETAAYATSREEFNEKLGLDITFSYFQVSPNMNIFKFVELLMLLYEDKLYSI
jgi:hypothetical protein